MVFCRLKDQDVEAGFRIIESRINDLIRKGSRQYLFIYPPYELYMERQKGGFHYGLYEENSLASIVTLIPDWRDIWSEYLPMEPFIWISSLFTAQEYKGRGCGRIMMASIDEFAQNSGFQMLFLDYYADSPFLHDFYRSCGFNQVVRKTVSYPTRTFDSVLMNKDLFNQ